jgi:hypothetical protein
MNNQLTFKLNGAGQKSKPTKWLMTTSPTRPLNKDKAIFRLFIYFLYRLDAKLTNICIIYIF